ncbi:unnamed protein product [Prunus armeniaca]|uniref:Uncharacterized protein n=1 Tax=Prunus armeniaca TaxID=36596 RepID=A0A6J5Y1P0_PRUAR|nr:unnamed protein product [Prunus armeniaca]
MFYIWCDWGPRGRNRFLGSAQGGVGCRWGGDSFPGSAQGEGLVVGCGLWVAGWGVGGGGERWVSGGWGGYRDRDGRGGFGATGGEGMVIKKPKCTKLLKHPCYVIKLNGLLDGVNGRGNVKH